MTNFGDIVNITSRIDTLKEQINQLEGLKSEGNSYAILYPEKISTPSNQGLPFYIPKFHPIKLYNRVSVYYKDEWSVKPVKVVLEMCKPPKFIAEASGWLKAVSFVKFIASDGEYVYIKHGSCIKWVRVGNICK